MPVPLNILLIEDDPDDIEFLREALKDNGVAANLETLTRGDLITSRLISKDPLPDLIVMDLNLPKLHGREVLCLIRENTDFSKIPVVVLTTSSLEEDRQYCLRKGVQRFISKPSSPEGYNDLVRTLTGIIKTAS